MWHGFNNVQAKIYTSSTEVYTTVYMNLEVSNGLPQQALAAIPAALATTRTPLYFLGKGKWPDVNAPTMGLA